MRGLFGEKIKFGKISSSFLSAIKVLLMIDLNCVIFMSIFLPPARKETGGTIPIVYDLGVIKKFFKGLNANFIRL